MKPQNSKKSKVLSEINVTPLVDVMLVLLIIFMISAPLLFTGVKLKLPKTVKNQNVNLSKKNVIVSITNNGTLYLGDQPYELSDISSKVLLEMKEQAQDSIFVRADAETPYKFVAKLMSQLKVSGVENISLVTEIETLKKK